MAQVKFLEKTERYSSASTGVAHEDILANRIGYGANTTGGQGGTVYHVTTLNDSGAGSLRAALESINTYWIVFDVSGTITFSTSVYLKSNKTIDGRGANITLAGKGLYIGVWGGSGNAASNIIIHNIKYSTSVTDTVRMMVTTSAHDVWVDHITFGLNTNDVEGFYFGGDGSHHSNPPYGVTVSWCKFDDGLNTSHGAMLISDPGDPEDVAGTLTVHHNWLNVVNVRHPLMRNISLHSFNTLYDRGDNGVQVSVNGNFRSDNDIFVKPGSSGQPRVQVWTDSSYEGPSGNVAVNGEWLQNSAVVQEHNPGSIFTPPYSYSPTTADATLQSAIQAGAGWLDVALPT